MPQVLKNLGQGLPAAATLTPLYVAAHPAASSSLVICNTDTTPCTVRVSHAIAGAADSLAQYLYYDFPIAAKGTFKEKIGITIATTDVIRIWSSNSLTAFNLYGVEN